MAAWTPLGLLLEPPRAGPWSRTHAALPTPLARADGDYDLFFSSRDDRNRASIGRALLRANDGRLEVREIDALPVLGPGRLGAFDDCGVTVSHAVRNGERTLLYYTGWTQAVSVPFLLASGLAIDEGDGFRRLSDAPMLDRIPVDPYLNASPFVLRDGDLWRMWYVSATGWEPLGDAARHSYHIKYAESRDGVAWQRDGLVAVDYRDEREYALARPWVLRGDGGGYEMWFSARGSAYRLGYASSQDGLTWHRSPPPADIAPSDSGWNAEMVAYPALLHHEGHRFLLYNGAGYGRDGIGYAVWNGAS